MPYVTNLQSHSRSEPPVTSIYVFTTKENLICFARKDANVIAKHRRLDDVYSLSSENK